MFKALVEANRITVTNPDKEIITSGSVNVNFIEFTFTDDWIGLEATVIFQTRKAAIPIILSGDSLIHTMPIPWEVLTNSGETINIGAYGIRMDDSDTLEDEEKILPTVWGSIPEKVREGVTVLDPTPTSPTYNAYQLLLKTIADIIANGGGGGGVPGISPTISIEETDDGVVLTIVDVNGERSVTITNGVDGTDGSDGSDGFSPTISVTPIEGGNRLTITDVDGEHSFDFLNGQGDSLINRCVWITWAGSDLSIFEKNKTNVASIDEFIGHAPNVSNNNIGLILVSDRLYWSKFNITEVRKGSVVQAFTQDPILIGPLNEINGEDGKDGVTFIPSVSKEGLLTWTNNGDLPNPDPVNIRGSDGDASSNNIYSTAEVVIGKWFGKPLYRKVCRKTVTVASSTQLIDATMSKANTNRETVCNIYGSVSYGNSNIYYPIPFLSNSGDDLISVRIHDDGLHIFYHAKNGMDSNNPVTISATIEYTKSTD